MSEEKKEVVSLQDIQVHNTFQYAQSQIFPTGKSLTREEMIEWVKNVHLNDNVYFLRWDYPGNEKYNLIEMYLDVTLP